MAININISNGINNDSLQVGDVAYYVSVDSSLPIDIGGTVYKIGEIDIVTNTSITVNSPINTPSNGDFIMFSKDNVVNNTSLVGYYAEVTIENNSDEKAEIFTIGSEVTSSSK
jgi:hypothetical protein